MRMNEMYYKVKEWLNKLNDTTVQSYRAKNTRGFDDTFYRITSWNTTAKVLDEITGFFDNESDIFSYADTIRKNVTKSFDSQESIEISDSTLISSNLSKLRVALNSIVTFCEQFGFSETPFGFDVKMPPTKDFSEFADYIKQINYVLSMCPCLNETDEKIELKKTDSGSIWFEFVIIATTSSVLLHNLAKLVDHAVKIKSHIVTVKQQEESLRAMKVKNDMIESVVESYNRVLPELIKNETQSLISELGNTYDGEEVTKTEKSIEILSNLMSKGLEIYASIDAPKETKDLFPTSEEIKALPGVPKLIENKTETE